MEKPTLRKNKLKDLLKLSTSGLQFSFNPQIYSQHNGVAMGLPFGPIFANTFMGFIKAKIIPSFKYKLQYFRYVDDCFVLAEIEDVVDELFTILNEVHNARTFAVEK